MDGLGYDTHGKPLQPTATSLRREFLVRSAIANDGVLVVKEARVPMVESGLFESYKMFHNHIYALINSMDCWLVDGPGRFRFFEVGEAPDA